MRMKRASILTATLVFLSLGSLFAQPAITVTPMQNADWGQIISCNCTEQLLLTDAGTGQLSVSAQKNNTVVVTISYPATLNQLSGTDTINYSVPRAAYNNTGVNDKNTATQFSGDQSTETIIMPDGKGGTTTLYLYIYGDLSLSLPSAGSYSNTITVSVTYQ